MKDIRERYMTDPVFATVVNSMRALIIGARLTPSEVREAAMLACIIEEEHRPAAPFTTSDEELEIMRKVVRSPQPSCGKPLRTPTVMTHYCTLAANHPGACSTEGIHP